MDDEVQGLCFSPTNYGRHTVLGVYYQLSKYSDTESFVSRFGLEPS